VGTALARLPLPADPCSQQRTSPKLLSHRFPEVGLRRTAPPRCLAAG
jgi:hypothetical protein